MVLVVLAVGTLISAMLPTWINPNLGVQNDPRITKLVYPTFGNPAIIAKGQNLQVEYDPREQDFGDEFVKASGFKARVTTSNGPAKITRWLPVVASQIGYSTQWPEYGRTTFRDRRMYLVTLQVPRDLPRDLYDLTVLADIEGISISDTQPHALQSVDAYKDDFSFVQITDVHVWGQEIYYPGCTYYERSPRPNGTDQNRKGAIYYQKEIDQINLARPDFVVMSGDCMFGQRYFIQDNGPPWGETTEYQYEMLWFYQETLRLDVPVFMVMGNHDSYNEARQGAHEDWFDNWRKLYGPSYHAFDYGDYHFVASNSQDWTARQRQLIDWEGVILQPKKYKGELRGGGDGPAPGITQARLDALDDSSYKGELGWIRDDLKAHQGSKMRVMVMHHDPYKTAGSGEMWGEASGGGLLARLKYEMTRILGMGEGEGRLAIIKLMQDYHVGLEISGHDHSDYVATRAAEKAIQGPAFVDAFTWKGGGGEVKYVNTTSTQFQSASSSLKYPGYRKIHIVNGEVLSFNYKDPKWSYPVYKGTSVGGVTDLGKLTEPAIAAEVKPTADSSGADIQVANSLDVPLEGAYMELALPYLSGGYYYTITGGVFGEIYPNKDQAPDKLLVQVLVNVPQQGSAVIAVRKSTAPDTSAPVGTGAINGGARTTGTQNVKLTLKAADSGAGVSDMMVSNTPDFKDASWEPYRTSIAWTLGGGGAGTRTVYVKFRDAAMPGNESQPAQAGITYVPGR
jgi:3',5'-cyclic AMP phosphodiesterase CpdA